VLLPCAWRIPRFVNIAAVAESLLVKHQLLILNRSRKRSPNLRSADRAVAGLCAFLIRPGG